MTVLCGLMMGVAVGPSAYADATLPPVKLPPVTLDSRGPQQTDDGTSPNGLPDNAAWQANGILQALIDNTAGFAAWNPQGNEAALPMDIVGMYVCGTGSDPAVCSSQSFPTPAIVSGGSGYSTNQLLYLKGGAVLKVTSQSGGVIQAGGVTVVTPYTTACPGDLANPVSQQATTGGSGTGATFNISLLRPSFGGTKLLSRCYTGTAFTAQRSDTGEQKAIGFLSGGNADWATFDGFVSGGTSPGAYLTISPSYTATNASGPYGLIAAWNDQSGQGNNLTQATAADMPFVYAGRKLGNARSIMFSAASGAGDVGTVPNPTWLNIPAGVSVAPNNVTLAVLSGSSSADLLDQAEIALGSNDPVIGGTAYMAIGQGTSTVKDQCWYHPSAGTQTTLAHGAPPTDEARLSVLVSSPTGIRCDSKNKFASGGGNWSGSNIAGGKLGGHFNSTVVGQGVDIAAAIIVPWALTQAQENALAAALYRLFGVTPQAGGALVVIGDSHSSGYGTPFQQGWPRQMMQLLGRNDLSLTVAAAPGETCANYASTGGKWAAQVAPVLALTNAQRWVLVDCGYNDLGGSATLAQVEGYYATIAGQVHAAGGRMACVADVIRNGSAGLNANVAALGAYLSTASFCDLLINFQSYSVFAAQAGPWAAPWFEQMDSGVHLTPAGNALEAEIAAAAMKTVLQ